LGITGGCEALVEVLAEEGDIDLLLCSAGSAPMRHIVNTESDDWEAVLRTNVVGFNELVRAVLPHMTPTGVVAALSSETVVQPREALAAYAASKAALEASIRGWRTEHHHHRFMCIRVGATQPTEFGDHFDGEVLGPVLGRWIKQGLLQEEFMATDDVAAVLAGTLAVVVERPGVGMEDIVLRSPSPPLLPS
jgi:NADP-dependent 3-hydroxy acid dehydrogenase YdfG